MLLFDGDPKYAAYNEFGLQPIEFANLSNLLYSSPSIKLFTIVIIISLFPLLSSWSIKL